ncbi:unnamed protein product [Caenorhabditis bovis]|uniref:CCHC-type domain-containing protein n=1 Tax=Caenorhabditis bovis TaxID=2654633 RepID=A0A8S1F880_9PELO|nr:unnamed protein product [Caenorhabditis bovis]
MEQLTECQAAIVEFTQWMRSAGVVDDEAERKLVRLETSVGRLDSLSQNLRTFGKKLKAHEVCEEKMRKIMREATFQATERQRDRVVAECVNDWQKIIGCWSGVEGLAQIGCDEESDIGVGGRKDELRSYLEKLGVNTIEDIDEMIKFNADQVKQISSLNCQINQLEEAIQRKNEVIGEAQKGHEDQVRKLKETIEQLKRTSKEYTHKNHEEQKLFQTPYAHENQDRPQQKETTTPASQNGEYFGSNNWKREERAYMNEEMLGIREALECLAKANLVPDPEPFDGHAERNLHSFAEMFLSKYENTCKEDRKLTALMREKFLKGRAKTVFNGLGERVWRMTFREVIQELGKALNELGHDSIQASWSRWNALKKREDQKLSDFCASLKEISAVVFQGSQPETIAQARLNKLMESMKDSAQRNLLAMRKLEIEPAEQYHVLKRIAIQFEWERQEWRKNTGDARRVLHHGAGRANPAEKLCYRCGGRGHLSRECIPIRLQFQRRNESGGQGGTQSHGGQGMRWNGGRGPGAEQPRQVNQVEGISEKEEKNEVGASIVEKGVILGQEVEFLVDSGAVVSLLSSKTWEKLTMNGGDWKKEAIRLVGVPDYAVVTADKKPMEVLGQVECSVTMRGRTRGVRFQIVKNDSEIALIGTNAFPALGIYLMWSGEEDLVRCGRKIRVPPKSHARIEVSSGLPENITRVLESHKAEIPDAVVTLRDGKASVAIENLTEQTVVVAKGEVIGKWAADECEIWEADEEYSVDREAGDLSGASGEEWKDSRPGNPRDCEEMGESFRIGGFGATTLNEEEEQEEIPVEIERIVGEVSTKVRAWDEWVEEGELWSILKEKVENGEDSGETVKEDKRGRGVKVTDFELDEDKIVRRKKGQQKVVPKAIRRKLFQELHSGELGGHWGIGKTSRWLAERDIVDGCGSRDCTGTVTWNGLKVTPQSILEAARALAAIRHLQKPSELLVASLMQEEESDRWIQRKDWSAAVTMFARCPRIIAEVLAPRAMLQSRYATQLADVKLDIRNELHQLESQSRTVIVPKEFGRNGPRNWRTYHNGRELQAEAARRATLTIIILRLDTELVEAVNGIPGAPKVERSTLEHGGVERQISEVDADGSEQIKPRLGADGEYTTAEIEEVVATYVQMQPEVVSLSKDVQEAIARMNGGARRGDGSEAKRSRWA